MHWPDLNDEDSDTGCVAYIVVQPMLLQPFGWLLHEAHDWEDKIIYIVFNIPWR